MPAANRLIINVRIDLRYTAAVTLQTSPNPISSNDCCGGREPRGAGALLNPAEEQQQICYGAKYTHGLEAEVQKQDLGI